MKTTELQEATLPTLTSHSEPLPRIDNKALEAILQCSLAPAKLNDEEAQSSIQIDKDVLARLCRLNSRWHKSLLPLLYQSIHLATADQAGSLLSTLQNHPEKRRLIRSILITIPPQQNQDDSEQIPAHRNLRKLFQKNVPALEGVYLLTSTFMSAMTYVKDCLRGKVSLRRITIICHGPCIAMSTSYVWSILKGFPDLEAFRFEFTGTDGVKQETLRALPSNLHLSKATLLSISGIVIDDETVEELGHRCPNLNQMEINSENKFCVI